MIIDKSKNNFYENFLFMKREKRRIISALPVLLRAQEQPQSFYTKGYDKGQYPNDLNCSWILKARTPQQRIVLTIHDSKLDDALFTQCEDYLSVRDG